MKLIRRDTDYAIRAILSLAKARSREVSTKELAENARIPRPFLRRILQTLHRAGIVKARRGIGGGFAIRKNPAYIRIVDIIQIFQGPFVLNECMLSKRLCPNRKGCPLKKKIDAIEVMVKRELKKITIGELLG